MVDLCSNDLIYIIDADNIPQEKLDNTIDEIIKSDNKITYIYHQKFTNSKIFTKFQNLCPYLTKDIKLDFQRIIN